MLTGRYQGRGKTFFCTLIRVGASLIEALKFNLLARIKVDAWIQTQRKMLIEFRGSELWNHQRVNSIFFQKKANLFASSREFYRLHLCLVRCVYLFIKVEGGS